MLREEGLSTDGAVALLERAMTRSGVFAEPEQSLLKASVLERCAAAYAIAG